MVDKNKMLIALMMAIDEELDRLEAEVRLEMFIKYCNTSCWRYKCD